MASVFVDDSFRVSHFSMQHMLWVILKLPHRGNFNMTHNICCISKIAKFQLKKLAFPEQSLALQQN